MRFELRPYQRLAVDYVAAFLRSARPGDRKPVAAPTGVGKSVIELALLDEVPGCWLIVPRVEIVAGMLDKLGFPLPETESEASLLRLAESRGIWTPGRLRNRLLAGRLDVQPKALIFDEGHHATAETYQQILLLCGNPPSVLFTATPYRGTPAGTADFRREWGEPQWIITYPEAVRGGFLSFPECRTVALVDDDEIEVVNGEFVASQVESAIKSAIDDVARRSIRYTRDGGRPWLLTAFDRPTMYAMPTRQAAAEMHSALTLQGIPAVIVDGETPHGERQEAFRQVVACEAALVQIQVVSEGVDLPIRRLIDLSPTISPVRWLQQVGRIMRPVRPGEQPPEYVCTNRNLIRHGYLLDGCLPPTAIVAAQAAFGSPGQRAGIRVLGLEALGRLRPAEVRLKSGLVVSCYSITATEGHHSIEYFAIVHPAREEPIWAQKRVPIDPETGERDYKKARWVKCDPPADCRGFASKRPNPLTEPQQDWWNKSAEAFGLDKEQNVTNKTFSILPVLCDLRLRLK